MIFIVIKDLVIPSGMNKWAASVIGFVLLSAPIAFAIKNIYVVTASFNL